MALAIAITTIRPRWALVADLTASPLVQVVDIPLGLKTSLTHSVENASYGLTRLGLSVFVTLGISSGEALGASDQVGQANCDGGREADSP
jgi:hypothetical protein